MAVIPNSTVPPTDSYFWDSSWLKLGLHFTLELQKLLWDSQTKQQEPQHQNIDHWSSISRSESAVFSSWPSCPARTCSLTARLRSALLSPWGLIARLTYRCLLPFVLPLALTSGKQWCRIKQGWARLVQCLCRCVVCRDTLWYSGELLSFFCRLCVIYLTTNLISCQGTMGWCIFYVHTLRSDPQGCGRSI